MLAAPTFRIQGISMSTYSATGYEGSSYTNLLNSEVIDGANYVELSSDAVIDLGTGAITDRITNGLDNTAMFSDMGAAIAAAEAKGLNVMLKPQIAAYDPALMAFEGTDYGNLTDPSKRLRHGH
jgi:hypothetical protein